MLWLRGVIGGAWLVSQTIGYEVECGPTRVLAGFAPGNYAQCFVAKADLGAADLAAGLLVRASPWGASLICRAK